MGVTLWIVPSKRDTLRLKRIMHTRNPKFEASYPEFDPHITLAALPSDIDIPLSAIRQSIPASQTPLAVIFKSIEIGTHFFRSVYLAIKPTPTLAALHAHVHAVLGLQPRTPAFPHASLCYIRDEDAAGGEREKFLKRLEDEGRVKGDGNRVSLNCGEEEEEEEDWMDGFEAPEIWVAKCEGPVETWTILEKISLGQ